MNREKQLVKNTAILTFGKVCTQLITFFLLPLYTKMLSTEEFGIVDLLSTLVLLLLPVVTLKMEQGVFRHLIDARENEEEKKKLISTAVFSEIVQIVIYIIIFLIISPFIHNEYKFFLMYNVVAYGFSTMMLEILRGLGDNTKYAIASFISAFTTIILNIVFIVIFKIGATGMLLANMLGQFSSCIFVFIAKKIYSYINYKYIKKEILIKLWKYSIPLIPSTISWWIFNTSDRVIVTAVLGLGMNGILSVSHKFPTLYVAAYNIFNMSWTEMVSLHIEDDDSSEFLSNTINTVLKLYSAVCFGIIACMPFVFNILVNSNYAQAYNQIPILMIASLFNVVTGLISVVYVAKKNSKAIAVTAITSSVINIVIHIILIKFLGLYAATISTLIAFLTMSINRLRDIKKKYNIKIKIEMKFIIITILITPVIFTCYYINNLYINMVSLFITLIYAYTINNNFLKTGIEIIKNKFKK